MVNGYEVLGGYGSESIRLSKNQATNGGDFFIIALLLPLLYIPCL